MSSSYGGAVWSSYLEGTAEGGRRGRVMTVERTCGDRDEDPR